MFNTSDKAIPLDSNWDLVILGSRLDGLSAALLAHLSDSGRRAVLLDVVESNHNTKLRLGTSPAACSVTQGELTVDFSKVGRVLIRTGPGAGVDSRIPEAYREHAQVEWRKAWESLYCDLAPGAIEIPFAATSLVDLEALTATHSHLRKLAPVAKLAWLTPASDLEGFVHRNPEGLSSFNSGAPKSAGYYFIRKGHPRQIWVVQVVGSARFYYQRAASKFEPTAPPLSLRAAVDEMTQSLSLKVGTLVLGLDETGDVHLDAIAKGLDPTLGGELHIKLRAIEQHLFEA